MKIDVRDMNVTRDAFIFNVLLAMVSTKVSTKFGSNRFVLVDSKVTRCKLRKATHVFDMAYGKDWSPISDWGLLGEMIVKFDVDSIHDTRVAMYKAMIAGNNESATWGSTREEAIAKAIILQELGAEIELNDLMSSV